MKQRTVALLALAVPVVLLCTAVAASAAEQGESHTEQVVGILFKTSLHDPHKCWRRCFRQVLAFASQHFPQSQPEA